MRAELTRLKNENQDLAEKLKFANSFKEEFGKYKLIEEHHIEL
jgi:hypothetical protein